MSSPYRLVIRSQHTPGGYRVGDHDIISLDVLEFLNDGQPVWCRVEHDGLRYMISVGDRLIPLAELVWARYVGRDML